MEEAAAADHVVILEKGNICAQGTPDTLKNQYGKDTLRLRFADMDDGLRKLKAMGYQPKQNADRTIIPVQDCQEALKIINSLDNFIDFELIKGSMDDVFLAATGRMEVPR